MVHGNLFAPHVNYDLFGLTTVFCSDAIRRTRTTSTALCLSSQGPSSVHPDNQTMWSKVLLVCSIGMVLYLGANADPQTTVAALSIDL
jgi:hypothetical protein